MGVGQSTELAGKLPGKKPPFVIENKDDIYVLLRSLADTIDLSKRGCNDDSGAVGVASATSSDPQSHDPPTNSAGDVEGGVPFGEIPNATPRKFTEEEIRELFSPYEHLLLANHYLGDNALTETIRLPVMKTEEELMDQEAARRQLHSDVSSVSEDGGEKRVDDVEEEPEEIDVPVLDVIAGNPYLTTLDVGYNYFTDVAVSAILRMIDAAGAAPHLQVLSFAGNQIGRQGCAALGEWLALNPMLERLSLFHCQLHDTDVVPLLEGLFTNTNLRVLQLDWNFCTWKTLDLLRQVIQVNQHLAVVMVQSVPYHPHTGEVAPVDLSRMIEYPCTPQGYFRSGAGAPADDADPSAAEPRWFFRKQLLRVDMSGMHPLPHCLLQELDATLRPRREAYTKKLAEERAAAMAAHVAEVMRDPHEDYADEEDGDAAMSKEEEATEGAEAREARTPTAEDATVVDGVFPRTAAKPLRGCYPALPPILANFRKYRDRRSRGAHGKGTGASNYMGSLRRQLPPLNSKERLQMVMGDAHAFRYAFHRTLDKVGEKVRPNGLDAVYMPPIHGGGFTKENTLLHDMEARHLLACWCDPHEATVPYGGKLHYHCKRECAVEYGPSKRPPKGATQGLGSADVDSLPLGGIAQGPYKGCQGSGHRCVSVPPAVVGAKSAESTRPRRSAASTAKQKKAASVGTQQLFTTKSGVTMALQYNPVAYFTAPYQHSALIVDECKL